MTGRIAATPVDVFLDALASDAPTPGGGAVAALAGASGAALISMVCNLTIGRTGYEEAEERMRGVLDEAEASRTVLLDLADRDAAAFGSVMAAFKMPKETDAERRFARRRSRRATRPRPRFRWTSPGAPPSSWSSRAR